MPTQTKQPKIDFAYQPSQTRLLREVKEGTGTYSRLIAPQCLEVGGQRSGKTQGKLKFFVDNYCLRFSHCDILVLRRKFGELESGVIQDFKTIYKDLIANGLCKYNESKHVAEFANGSRVVFGGCVAEGTLIDTARGLVPIEDVTTEDFVLTRKGWRRVLWSGQTGVKLVYPLGPLNLTLDHKVLVNEDFRTMDSIVWGGDPKQCQKDSEKTDRLFIRKSSYSLACRIEGTQTQKSTRTGDISTVGAGRSRLCFIGRSGSLCTDPYPQEWTAATKTTTASTTPLTAATMNSCQVPSTGSIAGRGRSCASTSLACVAAPPFLPSNFEDDFARIPVPPSSTEMSCRVPVYDLTVEGQHEYFANGILVHNCLNNKDKDIETYLGQAYPGILVDECAQFSPDAWDMLYMRNTVNAGCEPDEHGNFPVPSMAGCTNPIGPFWDFYHTTFALRAELGKAGIGKGEPFIKEPEWKAAKDGSWWLPVEGSKPILKYNPRQYGVNHSTMLENHEYQKRDPMALVRLKSLPEAKQKKFLYGLLDTVGGQYFEPFSPDEDVIDLRLDPEAVIWQTFQPVWGGQDWGMGHWNACYLFTKGLVRRSVGDDYVLKTICFAEIAPFTAGHTSEEMVAMISQKAYYPRLPETHPQYLAVSGKRCDVKTIYFSHEKFNRVMEQHSPADLYSQCLLANGLPAVTRGTMDRIGSASFMYSCIKKRELCILAVCPGIIQAIPQLQRDPKNLDDVEKTNSIGDDRYDAFRLGLYGELGTKSTPRDVLDQKYAATLNPFERHFWNRKRSERRFDEDTPWVPQNFPSWWSKDA